MLQESFTYEGANGDRIQAYKWLPSQEPRGVLQLAHGMAEHAQRYGPFARFMTNHGFAVYANDHRGHGQTTLLHGQKGFFANSDGWDTVVQDMRLLTTLIQLNHSQHLPLFLMGHSLGSLLSRSYAQRYGSQLTGLIISGTSLVSKPFLRLASLLVSWQLRRKGARTESPLLHSFTFGPYIRSVNPRRTDWDWLSRDCSAVDDYIADPLCGCVFTTGYYQDLAHGLEDVCNGANLKHIPETLPILLLAGGRDPVGSYGVDAMRLGRKLQSTGAREVSCNVYAGARHELLNELNKDEVYADILQWMEANVKR